MKLDIHDAFGLLIILIILGAITSIWSGFRSIKKSRIITYYRLRKQQVYKGVRTLLFAILLAGLAFILGRFGEPLAYVYFPPSPTSSMTPTTSLTLTTSLTPTVSETPTITVTPATSYTPTVTLTPFLPIAIEVQFKSVVTPNPKGIFSPMKFSLQVNNFQPLKPQTVFQNPMSRLFVTYSYDGMTDGVQWTEIWYQNGQILNYKTLLWDSGTGGFGQDELDLPPEKWLPGTYQLIFFVGKEWKVLGEFRIVGNPPTATSSLIPSPTKTITLTPSMSRTPRPTRTALPTDTRWPSQTPTK
jgi:type VI secretion system secreted protein VgrG